MYGRYAPYGGSLYGQYTTPPSSTHSCDPATVQAQYYNQQHSGATTPNPSAYGAYGMPKTTQTAPPPPLTQPSQNRIYSPYGTSSYSPGQGNTGHSSNFNKHGTNFRRQTPQANASANLIFSHQHANKSGNQWNSINHQNYQASVKPLSHNFVQNQNTQRRFTSDNQKKIAEKRDAAAAKKAVKVEEERKIASEEAAEKAQEQLRLSKLFPEDSNEDHGEFYCLVCRVDCPSDRTYRNHVRCMSHTQMVLEAQKLPLKRRISLGIENEEEMEKPKDETELATAVVSGGFSTGPNLDDVRKNTVVHCEVCECTMTGPKGYETHMSGLRHKKNLRNRDMGVPISRPKSKAAKPVRVRRSYLAGTIKEFKEPLLGLEYITEHQKLDPCHEPTYTCRLCVGKCDARTLFSHLTGYKHRTQYMKEDYAYYYGMVRKQNGKRSELNPIIEKYAQTIEAEHGRQSIKVEMEVDPEYEAYQQQLLKRSAEEGCTATNPFNKQQKTDSDGGMTPDLSSTGSEQMDYMNSSSTTYENQPRSYTNSPSVSYRNPTSSSYTHEPSSSYESDPSASFAILEVAPSVSQACSVSASYSSESQPISSLLKSMSTAMVSNEADAEMALQISKALNHALLSYRTQQKPAGIGEFLENQ